MKTLLVEVVRRRIVMKTLLVGLGIFLFTSSVWAGRFVETFSDGDMEGWHELLLPRAEPGSWEIIDGELHGISPAGFTRLLTMGDKTWRDYVIEFDVKPLEKHGPGNIAIAARVKNTQAIMGVIGDLPLPVPGPFASCFVANFGQKRFVFLDSQASALLELGEWSTLKLRVDGNIFTFWLNGQQILETTDPADRLKVGGVGLGLVGYTARFDNIVITGEGVPNKGHLPIEPQSKLALTWGALKRF